ncbi:glycoside hydrolase family 97 protein [Sandaracinobacteroides saxicola]|uniref:Glycoside hydrolase family 97 protein n=1 Tax=Sandaracinobacteroides saxicola TaxID=2759707 RepID=A0A7G5IFP1_9SPHN|nr:glycoside hydrolase family 97 protein [Sandaracinobacteroides saxicola]QMW22183.1 glycoside hydrolase family 97 protein [Sandaracinobacteroides saxicola]
MRTLITLFALLFASLAGAAPITVASPDGRLVATLGTDNDGRASYSLARDGKAILAPSQLGFLFADAPKIHRKLSITEVSRADADNRWQQPWGEDRDIRDHHRELLVALTETDGRKRTLFLRLRLFDDGFAFRYEFPEAWKTVRITEELTEFALAQPATAWWIPAGEWNREEYLYNETPVAEIGLAQTPISFRYRDGLHLSLHEAALVDYSGMQVQKVERGLLKAMLTPAGVGPKVLRTAPFVTPWRTLIVADSAAGLANSRLTLNLNEPNRLGDVSWVTPRKYIGIWWGMIRGDWTWASGPRHGATTARALQYIDFAARNGIPGLLIEGWNIGWDGDWFGNGEAFSFTQPYPDFDLERVAAYARKKGVHIIGHHETSGQMAHYEAQMGAGFDLYQRLGIDSVKTGYVSDLGGAKALQPDGSLSFEWHEGQAKVVHELKVVTEAAKRRIAINTHEPVKDSGLRRTYPNWISREGARGMEYNAWGQKNPLSHEPTLAFTRLLAGPMDFTPGVLSLTGQDGSRILGTVGRQLSLYIVIHSPIVMAADFIENYARFPNGFALIKATPTDWERSIMLDGAIGRFVVQARQDRKSKDWWLGALTNEEARSLTVPLGFLTPGVRYRATLWQDSGDGTADARMETRTVTAADSLPVSLLAGGGMAARFTPL